MPFSEFLQTVGTMPSSGFKEDCKTLLSAIRAAKVMLNKEPSDDMSVGQAEEQLALAITKFFPATTRTLEDSEVPQFVVVDPKIVNREQRRHG